MNLTTVKVIKPFNDCFTAVVDYQSYRLLKKTFRYDDNMIHELHKTAKTL